MYVFVILSCMYTYMYVCSLCMCNYAIYMDECLHIWMNVNKYVCMYLLLTLEVVWFEDVERRQSDNPLSIWRALPQTQSLVVDADWCVQGRSVSSKVIGNHDPTKCSHCRNNRICNRSFVESSLSSAGQRLIKWSKQVLIIKTSANVFHTDANIQFNFNVNYKTVFMAK